jgi:hypothetical protein
MGDPSKEYGINPGAMRHGIELWLDPVINRLGENNKSYETGQDNAAKGQSLAEGWVAGQGHGEVRAAAQSFFDQVTGSLQFLRIDQGQVIDSLNTYKDMLLKHVAWAERTDGEHAQNFNNIASSIADNPRWS